MNEIILKFIRFGIVGTSGLVIDFSITYLFKEKLKLNKFIANSIGFSLAVINNYFLNKLWTFQNHNSDILTEFLLFLMVCLVGLIFNNITLYLLNVKANVPFYFAKVGSVLVVILWNFTINYFYVFQ